MTAVLIFTIMSGCAVLSAIVAANKNRSVLGWGLIGFFFTLFGFLAALVVSEVEEDGETTKTGSLHPSSTRAFDPDEHEKKCPMCAEYIKLEARRCKHCGHEFSKEEVEEKIEEVKQEHKRTATQSRRDAKSVPESSEKSNPSSDPSNRYSTSDRPDTYAPDTSRTKRWVITLAVIGGIIVIIFAIAIQQAG